jgi:hypothetical protein
MTNLNRTTRRRLKTLKQTSSVWEGDRCSLAESRLSVVGEDSGKGAQECILWVDGTDAAVRSMDLVSPTAGPEAVVRGLLKAMENPHSPCRPSRPQKVVVRDREMQFYLRGVLKELDIEVEYAPALPIIDEIVRGLFNFLDDQTPPVPEPLAEPLYEIAEQVWQDAPWRQLDEEKIIAIDVSLEDTNPLYVSLLGLQGLEFGVLMYRSLDSLKTFRQKVMSLDDSPKELEEAFLTQDCFFVTYEQGDDDIEDLLGRMSAGDDDTMKPSFGNLHPLEGIRPMLYEEEALTVFFALSGLHRFCVRHLVNLSVESFPSKTGRYNIPNPLDPSQKVSVKVSTLPAVAEELAEMADDMIGEDLAMDDLMGVTMPILTGDLMPYDAFYSIGMMPWEIVELLRMLAKPYQPAERDIPEKADGLPIVLIQTSRPKAKTMIEKIESYGGMEAIIFNPGENPMTGDRYDLGILQTQDQQLHLFGEFVEDAPTHVQARRKWDQRCKKTKGYCGLVIARGVTGAARGNPGLNDMMAFFEVQSLDADELGLGPLQLVTGPE